MGGHCYLTLKGARIAILGVSYKPGVGDIRESPALKIIELLPARGADIRYHDLHVPSLSAQGLDSCELDELLGWAELAVLATAHPSVAHGAAVERVPLLVDLRAHTRKLGAGNVAQLYENVGQAVRPCGAVRRSRSMTRA